MTDAIEAQIVPPVDDGGDLVDLPNITKTDARTLTSLVRNDYKMLNKELGRRKERLSDEIRDQRVERQTEDEAEAKRELAGLVRRVDNLNKAIVTRLTELRDAGWGHVNTYRTTPAGGLTNTFDPHNFSVTFNSAGFVPPERDNDDLAALSRELDSDYYEAVSSLDRQEADIVRKLALQSVTSDGAREMILSLPTPESLLSAPTALPSSTA